MAVRPHLALVPGEPGGIGPELCVRIAQRDHACRLTVLADPEHLLAAANALGLPLRCKPAGESCGAGELAVLPFPSPLPMRPGHLEPDNSAQVIAALLHAGRGCLQGEFDGLVTGPVHKAAVNAAGIAHRQWIEDRTDELCQVMWRTLGVERTLAFLDLIEPVGHLFVDHIDATAGNNWMPAARPRRI